MRKNCTRSRINSKKANWAGHNLRRNVLLKHALWRKSITEWNIERRYGQLLDNCNKTIRYWKRKKHLIALSGELIFEDGMDLCGLGSSVHIATGYGLDGSGIEYRWVRYFPQLSTSALGPTQPPVQWVPDLSRGWRGAGAWRWPSPLPPSSAVVKKE